MSMFGRKQSLKQKPSEDEFNFESFDDDGFDSFEDDHSPTNDRKSSLVSRGVSSIKKDLAFRLNDPSERRRLLKDALPSSYTPAVDFANEAGSDLMELYREQEKEWEQVRPRIRRSLRVYSGLLRTLRLNKLADWSEQDELSSAQFDEQNAEEASVQAMLSEFAQSRAGGGSPPPAQSEEDEARDDHEVEKEEQEAKFREQSTRNQLRGIASTRGVSEQLGKMVAYQDQVTFKYQMKHLEIGLRTLLENKKQTELLKVFKDESIPELKEIHKNTGLPEVVKISQSELAAQVLKERMINKAAGWFDGKTGALRQRIVAKTKDSMRDFWRTFGSGVEALEQTAQDEQDGVGGGLMGMLKGLGVDAALNKPYRWATGKMTSKIQSLVERNSKLSMLGNSLNALTANGQAMVNTGLKQGFGNGFLDSIVQGLGLSSAAIGRDDSVRKSLADNLDVAQYMDVRFKKTIETVIPGWLGKIHKEAYLMRIGSKEDKDYKEVSYDWRSETFIENRKIEEDIAADLIDKQRVTSFNDSVERFLNHLDPDAIFTPKARKEIRKWFIGKVRDSDHISPMVMIKEEGSFSKSVRDELREKLPFLTGIDIGAVDKMTDAGVWDEGKLLMSQTNGRYKSFMSASANRVADVRGQNPLDLQKLSGLMEKYDPRFLENLGVIVRDGSGNLSINNNFVEDLVDSVGRKNYRQVNKLVDDGDGDRTIELVHNSLREYNNEDAVHRKDRLNDFKSRSELDTARNKEIKSIRSRLFDRVGYASGGKISLARGGSTGTAQPDQVADVEVHGQEYVVNSQATKNNEKILAWVNKLKAPLLDKDGEPNRVYYKLFGFKSAEDMDLARHGKNLTSSVKKGAKDLMGQATDSMISKLEDVVDFNVFSEAELKKLTAETISKKDKIALLVKGAKLTEREKAQSDKLGYAKGRAKQGLTWARNQLADKAKSFIDRDGTGTNVEIVKGLGQVIGQVGKDAKHGIQNQFSKLGNKINGKLGVDWQRTQKEWENAAERLQAGKGTDRDHAMKKVHSAASGALDLYFEGDDEPILTARGFRSGQYKVVDPSNGQDLILEAPIQIMGDVFDTKTGNLVVRAEDLVTHGVFTRRGTPVKLPMLSNEFLFFKRKREKLKELWGEIKGNDKVQLRVAQARALAEKVLWDQPQDIYTKANPYTPTLTAEGFKAGLYVNHNNAKVMVSHHDIDGPVTDLQNKFLITADDLTWGLFNKDGEPIKLSAIRRMRNLGMAKGKELYTRYAKKHVDKYAKRLANGLLSFQEDWAADKKAEQIDLYLATDPNTIVLTAKGFKEGAYLSSITKKVISRHGQIDGPVVNAQTGEVILNEQQLTLLVDVEGNPVDLMRLKGLSDRLLKIGKDALSLPGFVKERLKKAFNFGRGALKGHEEETTQDEKLAFGSSGIYIKGSDDQLNLLLSMEDVRDGLGVIVDSKGNKQVIKAYADFKLLGELYVLRNGNLIKKELSPDDVAKGLYSSTGELLYRFKRNAEIAQTKGALSGALSKLKGLVFGNNKASTNTTDDQPQSSFGTIDLYLKYATEPALRSAKLFTKAYLNADLKKAVTSYDDLDGTIIDTITGQVVVTRSEAARGLFDIEGNLIFKPTAEAKEGMLAKLKGWWSNKKDKANEAKASPDGYKQGEDTPVIIGRDLDAGVYTNAITGQVIKDYSQMFDGVIDGKGNKILYPADVEKGLFDVNGKLLTKRKKMSVKNRLKNKLGQLTDKVTAPIFNKLDSLREGSWQWLREKKNQAADKLGFSKTDSTTDANKKPWWMKMLAPVLAGLGLITSGLSKLGGLLLKGVWGIAKWAGKGLGKLGLSFAKLIGRNLWPMLKWGFKGVMAAVAMSSSFMGKLGSGIGKVGGALLGGRGKILKAAALAGAGYLGYKALSGSDAKAEESAGEGNADPQFDEQGNPVEAGGEKESLLSKYGGTALAVGSTLAFTGVGRAALMGTGRLALGLISGPVGWAALGATAAYYGGKWLYGKYKKNQAIKDAPLMAFRMGQYGFDYTDQEAVPKLLALEDYLSKFAQVSNGEPTISDKVDVKQVLSFFGVDPENPKDKERLSRVMGWFTQRFKPVYFSYIKQAAALIKTTSLTDLDKKLNRDQKLQLLEGVHFKKDNDMSPYHSMVSPFEKPDECSLNFGDVDDLYAKVKGLVEDMPEPPVPVAPADKKEGDKKQGLGDASDKPKDKPQEGDSWIKRQLGTLTTLKNASSLLLKGMFGIATFTTRKMLDAFGIDTDKYLASFGEKITKAKEAVMGAFSSAGAAIKQDYQETKETAGNYLGEVSKGVTNAVSGAVSTVTGKAKWSGRMSNTLFSNIKASSQKHGVPEEYMRTMAYIESKGDATARSSTGASGIYQFVKSTGKQYGLISGGADNRQNEAMNVDAGARLAKDNANFFKKRFGTNPEPWQLYMMHQQGAGGFCKLWAEAQSGQPASQAVRNSMDLNGGKGMSPNEFLSHWRNKWSQSQQLVMGSGSSGGGGGTATTSDAPAKPVKDQPQATKAVGQQALVYHANQVNAAKNEVDDGGAVRDGQGSGPATAATASQTQLSSQGAKVDKVDASFVSLLNSIDPKFIEAGKKAINVQKGVNLSGMNNGFMKLFYAMVGEYHIKTGQRVQVNSAYRDPAKQKAMYDAFIKRGKTAPLVAAPGKSRHEKGLAIDINSAHANGLAAAGLLIKYKFHRPLLQHKRYPEPWHLENLLFSKSETLQAVVQDEKKPVAQSASAGGTSTPIPAMGSTAADTEQSSTPNVRDYSGSNSAATAAISQDQTNAAMSSSATNNILSKQLNIQTEIRDLVKELRDSMVEGKSVTQAAKDKASLDNLKTPATSPASSTDTALNALVESLRNKLGGGDNGQTPMLVPKPPISANK